MIWKQYLVIRICRYVENDQLIDLCSCLRCFASNLLFGPLSSAFAELKYSLVPDAPAMQNRKAHRCAFLTGICYFRLCTVHTTHSRVTQTRVYTDCTMRSSYLKAVCEKQRVKRRQFVLLTS